LVSAVEGRVVERRQGSVSDQIAALAAGLGLELTVGRTEQCWADALPVVWPSRTWGVWRDGGRGQEAVMPSLPLVLGTEATLVSDPSELTANSSTPPVLPVCTYRNLPLEVTVRSTGAAPAGVSEIFSSLPSFCSKAEMVLLAVLLA